MRYFLFVQLLLYFRITLLIDCYVQPKCIFNTHGCVYLHYLETLVDLGDINLINKTKPFPELWLHSLLNSWTNMVKLRETLQMWLLTMSQEDGCAPRGWSCLEGTAGWRLKGRCWGHWGGATGNCWGVLLAEPECPPPQVAAQTWGCILFLLQWFSTVGWGGKCILVLQHHQTVSNFIAFYITTWTPFVFGTW